MSQISILRKPDPGNDQLNEDLQDVLDRAMLNDAEEEKLEREFRQEYHLITRDDRQEPIAKDIVNPFCVARAQGQGDGDLHRPVHVDAHVRKGAAALAAAANPVISFRCTFTSAKFLIEISRCLSVLQIGFAVFHTR